MTVATDPRKTGIYAPATLLAASAVAVIIPSSGSSNATGQITHTTALTTQPTGSPLIFLPAGVVTAGSQGTGAGLYQVTYSSTTVCQLTGTGIVTANAAYTQVTTEVLLATDTVPAGAMGLNGGLQVWQTWSFLNSATTKTMRVRFGGIAGTVYLAGTATTTVAAGDVRRIRNRGSAALQVGGIGNASTAFNTASGSAIVTSAVDTSVAADVAFTGQLGAATDFLILESRETWLLP